jgi:hypothetical protein
MLETVTSKAVSAVAVLALTGSVLGFFAIEKSAMEEQEFCLLCASLGDALDSLSASNAEARLNISFGEAPGLKLPAGFRGRPFDIEVRAGQVIFRQDGLTAVRALVRGLHPWDPRLLGNGTLAADPSALEGLDGLNEAFCTASGKNFHAERAAVVLSGVLTYQTFVHS